MFYDRVLFLLLQNIDEGSSVRSIQDFLDRTPYAKSQYAVGTKHVILYAGINTTFNSSSCNLIFVNIC